MKSRRQRLVDKLDKVFSKFIRNRDTDEWGLCKCYTCPIRKPPEEMDAGHYTKRGCMRTRWEERNVHTQCKRCNRFLGGNMDEYALHLIQDYGKGIIEELMKLKHLPVKKFTLQELEDMIEHYKLARV